MNIAMSAPNSIKSARGAHNERLPPESIRGLGEAERRQLEAALVRKIDWRLMPMLILMYIMNYLDRNNIAAARLAGLEDELNLTSTQYQTSVSILFVGYILMQIPSNMFLDKIGKPSIYLPACMIIWGIISGATAGVSSFGGLVACRLILGIVEAAYFPGCLFFLSMWYTRKELGFRTAMLYSGSLISGAFSGLISAGITDGMDGKRGLLAWRWLFLIEGAVTVVIAASAFFILPDFPKSTTWLSVQEKDMAIWRLEEDIGEPDWEGGQKENLTHGLKLAFTDIKTYMLMGVVFGIVSSGSVTNFFPSVVETLGYNRIISLLLTAPPYALAVITTFCNSLHADKTGERYFHITVPLWFSMVAFILAAATTTTAPRYLSMMLMVPSVYAGYVVALAWISNTLPRPPAKRAAAIAAINAVSNATSIWTAYAYPKTSAPRYVEAMAMNCATAALAIIAATILKWYLTRQNKKLDREEQDDGGFRYLV
ncbi:pantothenate transporter liz1 [Tricharina praecox]|uniref:pantothenate transporter liz1 n=1 Tax=Tricharina praecox TaxID=43433 RepID=UPI00221EE2A3|nr:pantothenate transporter liz1 [Tricharina praecox]KAI5854472.1 pantothenate transporter liz1 [Tricharina praecox]